MVLRGALFFALLAVPGRGERVPESSLGDCFVKDSASCVQGQFFRKLGLFFGQKSAELLGEVALERDARSADRLVSEDGRLTRQHRATNGSRQHKDVLDSNSAKERGSSFNIPRSYVTHEDTVHVSDVTVEGRGRKLKKLLPFLLFLKIQYFIYGVVAYVVIALIAKVALLKGSLALALGGVFLIGRLLSHRIVSRHEVQVRGDGHVRGDYNMGGGGTWDGYGAHADQHKQYAHNVAYAMPYQGQHAQGGRQTR